MKRRITIFLIFIIFSSIFFISGVLSALNLATIEHQKSEIIMNNPKNLSFSIDYTNTSYTLGLHVRIVNSHPFDLKIFKITWRVYLLNGTMSYQANNYEMYHPASSRIVVPAGKSVNLTFIDNITTHQWASWVLHNLKWQLEKYGDIKNVKWRNILEIYGMLGNFDGEKYQYNVRTWYLWHLGEVEMSYDGVLTAS